MSVATEEQSLEERPKCIRLLSILFPLCCLIVLLVGYAALGAVIFEQIEGGDATDHNNTKEYRAFLEELVDKVHNASVKNDGLETLLKDLHITQQKFQTSWLQSPSNWTFFGSMFFCCTVFTTVGYGQIYPVTFAGKLVCILYSMVGIPLMLLVITDVGDILAILVSKGYRHLHKLCRLPSYCSLSFPRCREKPQEDGVFQHGAYTFNQDVVIRAPMDIKQVLRKQASVKCKSIQLRNAEIFNRIIARERNFSREMFRQGGTTLSRSFSCPELNQKQPQRGLWDLCTGEELDKLDVPLLLILVLVFAYIFFGGLILPLWEDQMGMFDAFYFCFITLTTIGFGDIVPLHPKFFMLTSLYIIVGMAILSMAFKLGQSRFVTCYRQFIRLVSGGKVKKYEQLETN